MSHPDWTTEQQRCLQFVGRKFIAHYLGYTYEWEADNVVYARTTDQKPYLVGVPKRRISGKRGWLRSPQMFHAENLPIKQ